MPSNIVSGTVSVDNVAAITSVGVVGTISTVATVLVIPAVSVSVSAVLGTVVTVLGVVIPAVAGVTVAVSSPVAGVTGVAVWPGTPGYTMWMMMVTSTVLLPTATSAPLINVRVGPTVAATATSLYAVPAGKTLRIMNAQVQAVGSVTTPVATVQVMLVFASAAASLTQPAFATAGVAALVQLLLPTTQALTQNSIIDLYADIPGPSTMIVFVTMGTSSSIGNVIIQGFLF